MQYQNCSKLCVWDHILRMVIILSGSHRSNLPYSLDPCPTSGKNMDIRLRPAILVMFLAEVRFKFLVFNLSSSFMTRVPWYGGPRVLESRPMAMRPTKAIPWLANPEMVKCFGSSADSFVIFSYTTSQPTQAPLQIKMQEVVSPYRANHFLASVPRHMVAVLGHSNLWQPGSNR